MTTNQEGKYAGFASIAGVSTGTYNEVSRLAFEAGATVPASATYNEAFILWLQAETSSSDGNINNLKALYASQNGFDSWDAVNSISSVTYPYSLAGWKLTLPVNSSGQYTGTADEILQPALLTYSSSFFVPSSDFSFVCPDGGAVTTSATYARTELRHLTDREWNDITEDTLSFAVTNIGNDEKTVVMQTHDSSEPEFKIVYTGKDDGTGLLRILYKATEGDGDTTVSLKTGITNGDVTTIRVVRSPLYLEVYLDANVNGGTPDWTSVGGTEFTRDGSNGTYYWKRGNYYQVENGPPYDGTPTSTVKHYSDSSDDPTFDRRQFARVAMYIGGDSWNDSQYQGTPSSTTLEYRVTGYGTARNGYLGQMPIKEVTHNYANSGDTISDIKTQMSSIVTAANAESGPVFIALNGMTNDIEAATSLATIESDLGDVLDDALGIKSSTSVVEFMMPQPRGDWEGESDSTIDSYATRLHACRDMLTDYKAALSAADQARLTLPDGWSTIVDPTHLTTPSNLEYYPLADYMNSDGVYPKHKAADVIGLDAATKFKTTKLWGALTEWPDTTGQLGGANDDFSGTGGTAGTGASGDVADSVEVKRASGSNATAVCSKESTDILGITGTCQKVVFSGASGGDEEFYVELIGPSEPTVSITSGDKVEVELGMKIENVVGMKTCQLYQRITVGGTNYICRDQAEISGNLVPTTNREMILRTEGLAMPTTANSTRFQILLRCKFDGTVVGNGATLYLGHLKVVKV